MTYITRRNATYYLNFRLPKHLSSKRSTLRLALGITERRAALFMATALVQRVHEHLAQDPATDLQTLRTLCVGWRTSAPAPVRVTAQPAPQAIPAHHPASAKVDAPTLSTLTKLYIEEGKRGGTWRPVSTFEVERALRDLFELMGDMPVDSFDVQQARLLKDRLARCPQYFGLLPQFKGKTVLQVIESGAEYKAITATTVNNRLRKLSAFFNWCKSNSYVKDNPLAGLKMMTAGSAKEARLSFDTSDLTALLDLSTLRTEARKHPWRYWLPLMARASGCRLEELCQLRPSDFIQVQGIQCFKIDDSTEGQNLKNSSSRRTLPVHPTLIKLGLIAHVDTIRETGAARLFPDLVHVRGKLGHAPSKWFSRYKAKCGVTDPKKTFHSFRHLFIDDLRDAGVQDSLIKRMAGHEDEATSFRVYGSRTPLKAMTEALKHICVDTLKSPT